jgi:hypothetical protein
MAMVSGPGTGAAREHVARSAETNRTRLLLYILQIVFEKVIDDI